MPRTRSPSRPVPASASTSTIQKLTPLIVAAVTFIAFLPALQAGFVTWDDDRNIVANPHFRGLGADQLHWMWTTFHLGHYVPLAWMSLGLDYALWGMRPLGYHLTSLLLHCANAALLFVLARSLYGRSGLRATPGQLTLAAAAAALLFSVHPLRVESVAWVTERRDVLSLAFMLLATLSYLRFVDGGARRWIHYTVALSAFACALLSKATAMTLPAALLILNLYPLRRLGGKAGWLGAAPRRVYAEVLPFALLSAGAMVLSMIALKPPPQLGIASKLVVSAYSLAFYLWRTVVPDHLSPLYEMPRGIDPLDSRFVAAYFTVAALVGVLLFTYRGRRGVFAALLGFLVLVLPMLGFVQNGPQIAADRYTYHAAPALALLAGSILLVVGQRFVTSVAVGTGFVLLLSGALTWKQTMVWEDSNSLWEHVVAEEPQSSIGHSSLAGLLFDENRVPEAAEHSALALGLDSTSASAHTAVGVALARQGHLAEAVAHYQRALELDPLSDQAENNWGIALSQQGQLDEAVKHFQRALFLNPDNAGAQVDWGNALVRLGRPADAIPHYQEALTVRPDNADAHLNWGVALARQGNYGDAVSQFLAALSIDPAHAEAREYLEKARALIH